MHKTSLFFIALTLLIGCGRYQVKQPQPLEPQVRLAGFRARALDDPGLIRYLQNNLRSPAGSNSRWDLPALTLVAFYYHPEIELARARTAVVNATVITAGQRDNPNFGFGTTLETPFSDILPWILTPSLDLPFQRRSQREFRRAEAQHLADASRWDIASTAWQIRNRLRNRLTDYLFATRELDFLREEENIRAEYLSLLETKLELGDIPRIDVEAPRIELQRIRLQINAAQGRVLEARAALPEPIGVPVLTLEGIDIYDSRLDSPITLTDEQLRALESEALLNRIDIRRTLDEYSAAEAALQMQVAGQRPDFSLGPAFRWREGQHRWTLGFSFDLPTFNRNEGPIAEAEARREAIAKQFDHLQTAVVAEVYQATAAYRAATDERRSVIELTRAAEERLRVTQETFDLGDVDYTSVVAARLEVALSRSADIAALRKIHTALGMLENAIHKPLENEFAIPDVLEVQRIIQP